MTAGTGEPVGAWVSQIGTLGQAIRGNATCRHEFMYSESHHKTFRGGPRSLYSLALYNAVVYHAWGLIAIARRSDGPPGPRVTPPHLRDPAIRERTSSR